MSDTPHRFSVDAALRDMTYPVKVVEKLVLLRYAPDIHKAIPFLLRGVRGELSLTQIGAAELLLMIDEHVAEARSVFEHWFQLLRKVHQTLAVIKLGRVGPRAEWAVPRMLEMLREELTEIRASEQPNDFRVSKIAQSLTTILPPVETIAEPLVAALPLVKRETAERIIYLLSLYGRSAAPLFCQMLSAAPESEVARYLWKILMRIGWVPPEFARRLLQHTDKAPSRRDSLVVKLFDDHSDELPNILFDWCDDPTDAIRTGLVHPDYFVRKSALERIPQAKLSDAELLSLLMESINRGFDSEPTYEALLQLAKRSPEHSDAVIDLITAKYRKELAYADGDIYWKQLADLQPRSPEYLLDAMQDEYARIRVQAAKIYWKTTGRVEPSLTLLMQLAEQECEYNHPWDDITRFSIAVVRTMGTSAAAAIPALETMYKRGGYFSGEAAAALLCVAGPEHPLVLEFLADYEANSENSSGLRAVLVQLLTTPSHYEKLVHRLYKILNNGENLIDSSNVASLLWTREHHPELLWPIIVQHWLHSPVYTAEETTLATAPPLEYLQQCWPVYFELALEVSNANRDLAWQHLQVSCQLQIANERVNACRLLWKVFGDADLVAATLIETLQQQRGADLAGNNTHHTHYRQYLEIPDEIDLTLSILELLAQIGPPAWKAVPLLQGLLSSRMQIHHLYAVETLGAIGPHALAAVPEIMKQAIAPCQEYCGAGHQRLNTSAVKALCAITGCSDFATLQRVAHNETAWKLLCDAIDSEEIANYPTVLRNAEQDYARR